MRIIIVVFILLALGSCTKTTKPNIVFFLVDDMGWQDSSVPFHSSVTMLNERYHTPNMEQLAKDGVKFTQAYASAVCSPSRISLMTGMNSARHMVTNWTLRKGKSPDPDHPTIQPPAWNLNGLSLESGTPRTVSTATLPQLLQEEGYQTIHVGKAHFGATETPGEDPLNLGFDVNIAGHAAGGPGSYLSKYNFSADWRDPGNHIWDVPGLERYHGTDTFLTEALTLEAIKAVDNAMASEKPFYLYMSHYAIHAPWEKDERFYTKYKEDSLSDFDATFAAMIEGMDKSLGDIRMHLEKLGVADNTIIIFMSDNGSPSATARNLPLRGHKLLPYEGGVRVPMLVSWPQVAKPGSVEDSYLIIEDLFPTILEMAGLEEEAGKSLDGISLLPLLGKEGEYDSERPLFWHYPHTYDQFPYSSVRKGDWKLIYHHLDRKVELFNLAEDLSEKEDLAMEEPARKADLAKLLSDHLTETGALMPTYKTSGDLVELPSNTIN